MGTALQPYRVYSRPLYIETLLSSGSWLSTTLMCRQEHATFQTFASQTAPERYLFKLWIKARRLSRSTGHGFRLSRRRGASTQPAGGALAAHAWPFWGFRCACRSERLTAHGHQDRSDQFQVDTIQPRISQDNLASTTAWPASGALARYARKAD